MATISLDPVKNFAKVTVSTTYDASATSIVLSASEGAKLPQPSTDGAFNLVWYDSTNYSDPTDDPNREIVRCTARTTDTLTVTRGQESISASTKNTGGATYKMILSLTLKTMTDIDASYATLLGRSGGQTLIGGTGSGDDLTIQSTAHGTKGTLFLDDAMNLWPNFPDNPGSSNVMTFDPTFTDVSTSGISFSVINSAPTYTNTSATALSQFSAVKAAGTYNYAVNPAFTNLFQLFVAQPTLNITGASAVVNSWTILSQPVIGSASTIAGGTTNAHYGFQENPQFTSTGNSGSARWAGVYGFNFAPRMASGTGGGTPSVTTIDNAIALNVADLAKSGSGTNTLTNQYAVNVAALSSGVNNIAVRSAIASGANNYFLYGSGTAASVHTGQFRFGDTTTPGRMVDINGGLVTRKTTVSLTADNQVVTVGDRSYISLSSNSATATARTFVLTQSTTDGHRLTLEWTGTNAAELVDDSAQNGGGNHRMAGTWTPTQYDTISFISNGTDWVETSRSTN